MKNRLSALDGLRGLAALAVLLSHTGFGIDNITNNPFMIGAYRTLSVGPNSVQILFVLSGFLMAYLYPSINNALGFIKKRYARIIPVYVLIVIFLWRVNEQLRFYADYVQALFLLMSAGIIWGIWLILEKCKIEKRVGTAVFYIYLGLQVFFLMFNIFITPRFTQFGTVEMPDQYKNLLVMFSNVTLTTPFAEGVIRLSGVFWSLAPEIYFYLLYPIIVIPLIAAGKKYGWVIGSIITLSVVKILFDLDHAFVSLASLQSMNIARSSGFVIGVLVGTMYQMRSRLWQKIEMLGSNSIIGAAILSLFIAVQWGDWAVRDGRSIDFMNMYYLVSSVVIGLVIVVAIIPNTLVNRLFRNKFLVFLGFLSYSIYLIHTQSIHWASLIRPYLQSFITSAALESTAYLFFAISTTIVISYVLFKCVESLYFRHKQKRRAPLTEKNRSLAAGGVHHISNRKIITGTIAIILFFGVVYVGGYSPSLLLSRHSFTQSNIKSDTEVSVYSQKISIPITAQFDNLSSIIIDLRYFKNAEKTRSTKKIPAELYFRIRDGHDKIIFESKRAGYEIEGIPRFPFGFPTIENSKDKKYNIELELKNGDYIDQVFVNTSSTSMVGVYTTPKRDVLKYPLRYIINRIYFGLQNSALLFAVGFTVFIGALLMRSKEIKKSKS